MERPTPEQLERYAESVARMLRPSAAQRRALQLLALDGWFAIYGQGMVVARIYDSEGCVRGQMGGMTARDLLIRRWITYQPETGEMRVSETGRAALDEIVNVSLSPAQIAALEELANPDFWSAVNARRNTLESLRELGLVSMEMGMSLSSEQHDIPEYVINDAGRAALARAKEH